MLGPTFQTSVLISGRINRFIVECFGCQKAAFENCLKQDKSQLSSLKRACKWNIEFISEKPLQFRVCLSVFQPLQIFPRWAGANQVQNRCLSEPPCLF